MEEATSALDEASQEVVMKLMAEELSQLSVVSIGHRPGLEAFHHRELVLTPGEDGAELKSTPKQRAFRDIYKQIAAIDHSGAVPRNRFWSGRGTISPVRSGASGRRPSVRDAGGNELAAGVLTPYHGPQHALSREGIPAPESRRWWSAVASPGAGQG